MTHFVAIPEHLARVFRATRSPSKIFRTGPLTVAQCLMGLKASPSLMCHSTLYMIISFMSNSNDFQRTHTCSPVV